jgi:hypothetical protein
MANMSRKEHFHKALSDMSMEGFLQLVDQIWNAAFTATETLGRSQVSSRTTVSLADYTL